MPSLYSLEVSFSYTEGKRLTKRKLQDKTQYIEVVDLEYYFRCRGKGKVKRAKVNSE